MIDAKVANAPESSKTKLASFNQRFIVAMVTATIKRNPGTIRKYLKKTD